MRAFLSNRSAEPSGNAAKSMAGMPTLSPIFTRGPHIPRIPSWSARAVRASSAACVGLPLRWGHSALTPRRSPRAPRTVDGGGAIHTSSLPATAGEETFLMPKRAGPRGTILSSIIGTP